MYAVIQTGAKQYTIKEGDVIDVEKLEVPASKKELNFENVLLYADGETVSVGKPYVQGAKVVAEFIDTIKEKKIVTYKYKRRKSYHRTIGHRQQKARLRIKKIIVGKQ